MSTTVKFSSKLEEKVLADLKAFAGESKQSISSVLNEAVSQYLERARVRPVFVETSKRVIEENAELLRELAK